MGGLEEYIYNVRAPEPGGPLKIAFVKQPRLWPPERAHLQFWHQVRVTEAQNRRTALVAPKRKIYNLGPGSEPIYYHPKMTLGTSFLH